MLVSTKTGKPVAQVNEDRTTRLVIHGKGIAMRLREQFERAANARGSTVRLPPGALHNDAFAINDVENTPRARRNVETLVPHARVDAAFAHGWWDIGRVKIAMYDMDGTTIDDDCAANMRSLVPGAKEKEYALRKERDERGLPTYDSGNKRKRTMLFKGLPEEAVKRRVEAFVERSNPGAEEMFNAFRPYAKQVIASGGFTHFTGALVERFGLDSHQAMQLEVRNGVLTGKIVGDTLGPRAKARWLSELSRSLPSGALRVAVGNGTNDIKMFQTARYLGGVAVAYHAHPHAEAAADIAVRHAGLDSIPNYFYRR